MRPMNPNTSETLIPSAGFRGGSPDAAPRCGGGEGSGGHAIPGRRTGPPRRRPLGTSVKMGEGAATLCQVGFRRTSLPNENWAPEGTPDTPDTPDT